ncbi:MAG TPA: hypothetical protein VI136_14140, partial [Verrucomicrobiae bacterium]
PLQPQAIATRRKDLPSSRGANGHPQGQAIPRDSENRKNELEGRGYAETVVSGQTLLRLNVPFRYDPAQGNLLLDVRIYHPHAVGDPSNPERFAHDGIDALSDSVSRVYAWDVEAPVAARVDSDAIITEFAFMPTPSLTNALTTNAIVITWPSQPTAFSLEASDRLGAGANWQPYPTNQIGGGFLYRVITIPFQSMKREQYFRLVCEPCRPPP